MGCPIFKQTQTHVTFVFRSFSRIIMHYSFFWEKKHDKTIQLLGVARLETPHPSPARVAVVRAPRKRVNSARPPLHRCGSRGGSRWWRF